MGEFDEKLYKDRLLDVSDALVTLQRAFCDIKMSNEEQAKQAIQASNCCLMASLYVIELAAHLHDGMEFHEAMRATARGELKLSSEN